MTAGGEGSEYTAGRFRAACDRCGIQQSIGRPDSALMSRQRRRLD
jgi:hypothetical protein